MAYDARVDSDYYSQPGELFRLQSPDAQQRLISNAAEAMAGVPVNIQTRAVARFYQANERCGQGIAEKLGIDLQSVLDEVKRQQVADKTL